MVGRLVQMSEAVTLQLGTSDSLLYSLILWQKRQYCHLISNTTDIVTTYMHSLPRAISYIQTHTETYPQYDAFQGIFRLQSQGLNCLQSQTIASYISHKSHYEAKNVKASCINFKIEYVRTYLKYTQIYGAQVLICINCIAFPFNHYLPCISSKCVRHCLKLYSYKQCEFYGCESTLIYVEISLLV